MPAQADPEDARLVGALSSTDAAEADRALAALMTRYKRLAYGVAMETARNRAIADDVFQETFVRMVIWLRERPGVKVDSFARLMCAFVRRSAQELARAGRVAEMPQEDIEDVPAISLVDSIYARQLLEAVPEPARSVLDLTILRGMSSPEAAAALKMTPENVRVIRHRALRVLRIQQARDLADVEDRSKVP